MPIATNANALASYRRAFEQRAQMVIVRRVSGIAPTVARTDVRVLAIVMDYQPKPPVANVQPEGSVTLGARSVIVIQDDLAELRFPLPLAKNDKIITDPDEEQLGNGAVAGDEALNVISADPSNRGVAGAIDIMAEGV